MKTVQILINLNLRKLLPLRRLKEDGSIGSATIGAIEEFQRRVLGIKTPDGRVDPNGKTLKALQEGMPDDLSFDKMRGIMIHAQEATVQKYYTSLIGRMAASNINTELRMAHFLAQLAHESGELRYSEEIASGKAYEGRTDLGNTEKGDGARFKGRGLIQLTGRNNYEAYGNARGTDLTSDKSVKQVSSNPDTAVDVSCWFWTTNNLNELADHDNLNAITRKINGGLNGLADRKAKLARAKFFLKI